MTGEIVAFSTCLLSFPLNIAFVLHRAFRVIVVYYVQMSALIDVSYLEPDPANYRVYYARKSNGMGIEIFVTDSDGGEIRLPDGKDRGAVLTDEGIYDYYEEAREKDERYWRKKIGKYAAKHLLHPSQGA
jgi:hypothetical protein